MEGKPYRSISHTVCAFEVLQSLRKDGVLCDIKLKTDDGAFVYGHKIVLASASPYFRAMFTSSFVENNKECVDIHELDSVALKLSLDFIYSAEIMVTENNVQVLLPAANLLQLPDVRDACCEFLQTHLRPTNCLDIKEWADLHDCMELLSSSETYTRQYFSEVVVSEKFLSLSSEQVIELISNDELTVSSEEKVFESVIGWVNHNSKCRIDFLPKLMEQVRLPLVSNDYLLRRVKEEPLIKNSLKCKDYVIEALEFQLFKSEQSCTCSISKTERTKPRRPVGLHEVILVIGGETRNGILCSIEWYDPEFNQWHCGPELDMCHSAAGIAVSKDWCVFAMGGLNGTESLNTVEMLNLSSSSPSWIPTVPMLIKRSLPGVAVMDNNIFAVGGFGGSNYLSSAEVFNCITNKWRMISNMSTERVHAGVGVLNNILYVVGGSNQRKSFRSVECYHPYFNTWSPVAKMCERRTCVSVGVLDGVLYAVGGQYRSEVYKSVEAYKSSVEGGWYFVSDMHMCRKNAGVVALNGLLYVVGGNDGHSILDSVEIYNPNTDTWSLQTVSMNISRQSAGVMVINKPPHFHF